MNESILISVCIPVFDSELYLEKCLQSAYKQNFTSFEILVVSDASVGRDEKNRSAKKIVKQAQKECKNYRKKAGLTPIKIHFFEHSENRGLIEARRTLVYEAHGIYITQLDSDDELVEGALNALFEASQYDINNEQSGLDIIHGTSVSGSFTAEGNFVPSKENRYGKIIYDRIADRDIFHRWLIGQELTSNTWGKLIKKEIFLQSYDSIPYTQCNMAEDVLLFFFISQYAKSYVGIKNEVYHYRINIGMTSTRKIDTLQKWKMVCSTASVFTIISEWIKENENALLPVEIEKLRFMARSYLANNLKQMHDVVIPELQPQARELLCDYWGSDFVETMENALADTAG